MTDSIQKHSAILLLDTSLFMYNTAENLPHSNMWKLFKKKKKRKKEKHC